MSINGEYILRNAVPRRNRIPVTGSGSELLILTLTYNKVDCIINFVILIYSY